MHDRILFDYPPREMFKVFLFDLDGTLIDSIALIIESYNYTMAAHQREPRPDSYWRKLIGAPLIEQFLQLSDDEEEIEAMCKTYSEHNIAHHDAQVTEFDGMRAALETLRARGVRLAIVSSKRRIGVERGLRRFELGGLFEQIVAGDDVVNGKPHPEPVEKALRLMQISSAEAVFVGDSPHDMASGRAAQVATAAALWGPFPRADLEVHQPDHWLEHPRDLLQLT